MSLRLAMLRLNGVFEVPKRAAKVLIMIRKGAATAVGQWTAINPRRSCIGAGMAEAFSASNAAVRVHRCQQPTSLATNSGQRSRRTSAVMAALRMRGEGPTGYEPAAGLSGDEFRARIIEPHKQRYSSRRSGASSIALAMRVRGCNEGFRRRGASRAPARTSSRRWEMVVKGD